MARQCPHPWHPWMGLGLALAVPWPCPWLAFGLALAGPWRDPGWPLAWPWLALGRRMIHQDDTPG